jgi:hypothetical protein
LGEVHQTPQGVEELFLVRAELLDFLFGGHAGDRSARRPAKPTKTTVLRPGEPSCFPGALHANVAASVDRKGHHEAHWCIVSRRIAGDCP